MKMTATHAYFFTEHDQLSNWHIKDFVVKGITFNCIEQYMMYSKAKLFGDEITAEKILKEPKQSKQKALGRDVKPYDDTIWSNLREKVVTAGLLHKFSQNPELLQTLLSTGNRKLVEASKYDKTWGCGYDQDNPKILDDAKWPGLNLLGKCLETARAVLIQKMELKNEQAPISNSSKEREYWSGDVINSLKDDEIFVFGANPQARHFAGAAKVALKFGAVPVRGNTPGIARGLAGKTYALITKSLEAGYVEPETGIVYEKEGFGSVSPEQIRKNIDELYECAKSNTDKKFLITYRYETWPNGQPKKSLNGYTSEEFFNMFKRDNIPENIIFHDSYKSKIENKPKNKPKP